ncbi:hypothetical protein BGW38_005627 [Lunasporangiospora selenospora]|uniref:Uncharacterized protein n=1 Tax=Lunasporangiospora selenospora TaxID=979761 RepID=A0A9P6FNJ7_9FUNG|nr:hypothetical protein BGW38_005627 [Lunasporangiospora selenospora]
MVALTKSISLLLSIVLLGTVLISADAQKAPAPPKKTPAPAPEHSPLDMSRVIDCQAQCIELDPPFKNRPDHNVRKFMRRSDFGRMPYLIKNIQPVVQVQTTANPVLSNPCLKNIRKLKGKSSKVTKENFEAYVLCNSKTLGKNEEIYFSKTFNPKKNGFNSKQWTEFRNKTLPAFRSALHKCRGGCRKIHFAKKK